MDILEKLNKKFLHGEFDNFITEINLPYFKNIKIGTQINFTFPLTVLIGQNGCGKSSCLQAIKGCPEGNAPSENWFSTPVDEITQKDVSSKYSRISAVWPTIWYKYKKGHDIYEVLYQAVYRKNDPDYWEKREPVQSYGMTTKNRDPRIDKNVVYIDFRGELSAFDKYFYFGERHTKANIRSNKKQDYLRYQGQKLKKVFNTGKRYVIPNSNGTKFYNELPIDFTEEELKYINQILGKNYIEAQLVYHHLFESYGASILFKTSNLNYSEAFAGSGEMSASILVHKVLNAPKESLILLDEPEVSLHPLAQEKLKIFLLEQSLKKNLQIVVSTHSPSFVNGLPKEAIKVFREDCEGGFEVLQNVSCESAFKIVGFRFSTSKNILVEDILAKNILQAVINKYKQDTPALENININFNPGGAEELFKDAERIIRCGTDVSANTYIVIDGDKFKENFSDYTQWVHSELTLSKFNEYIKNVTGINDTKIFPANSNQSEEVSIQQRKDFIDYGRENIKYLPMKQPEEIIWNDNVCKQCLEYAGANNIDSIMSSISTEQDFKNKFKILSDEAELTIRELENNFIKRWINTEAETILQIKVNILDKII